MRKYLLLGAFIVCNQLVKSQSTYNCYVKDNRSVPREHSVDITHMFLDVRFEPKAGKVIGKVDHSFTVLRKSVDTIFFDAPGITIKRATIDNNNLQFRIIPEGVTVVFDKPLAWNETHKISFEYEATPRRGIYFIGWNDPAGKSRKQIWTQGQGIDHRNWIPMYDDMDDKFITETKITFDKAYKVLSNGKKLKESTNKDGTITWHYAMSKPHAGYLLMLAIGDYAIKTTKSALGVPINFWYYPDKPEWVEPTSRHTEKMMDFLENHIGVKYPWESYSQVMVQDFLYGAMENTTATIFGDFFACDNRSFNDRNYVGVNCHEMTHQWFGDFVTARSGSDTWLQESFATFYPKLFTRELYGQDSFQWARRNEQNSALEAGKKDRIPVRNGSAGTARVYQKGSAILDMLMYVLDEDAYRRVIKHYLEKHPYANVETNDLLQSIHDVTGMSLHWFFDQWLYRGGEPHYEISYNASQKSTQVSVRQIHLMDEVTGLFRMPVWFEVHYSDGSSDKVQEWIKDAVQQVNIPNNGGKQVAFVLFDPGSYILKTVSFKKSLEELIAQLKYAPMMIDRYDALMALKSYPLDKKKDVLAEVYYKEKFPGIRSEILRQMGDDSEDPNSLVVRGLHDPVADVRLTAVQTLKKSSSAKLLTPLLRDQSYQVLLIALEKACLLDPENAAEYIKNCERVDGQNYNVRIKWLEMAIRHNYEGKAIDYANELVELCSPSHEFRSRVAAMQSAKNLGIFTDKLADYMLDALHSPNGRLAGPAAEVFDYYFTAWPNRKALKESLARVTDPAKKEFIYKAYPNLRNL